MKVYNRILGAVTAAAIAFSSLFSVSASAKAEMKLKITYSTKYTYLEITPADKDNTIRYTTDGSVPDADSKKYKSKLRTSKGAVIRVAEFDDEGRKVDTARVTLKRKCPKPEINASKTDDGYKITISDAADGADIYYTTDGSKPTKKSDKYDGKFIAEAGTVIRAYAVKSGWKSSGYSKLTLEAEETVLTDEENETEYDDISIEILDLVNSHREKEGLYKLEMDEKLYEAAQIRAKEIAEDYSIGHDRPDGTSCFTVLDEVGFKYYFAAENIGYTEGSLSTPETIVKLWIKSSNHRKNIENKQGKYIGIASYKVGNATYWVQIFGEKK